MSLYFDVGTTKFLAAEALTIRTGGRRVLNAEWNRADAQKRVRQAGHNQRQSGAWFAVSRRLLLRSRWLAFRQRCRQ